MGVALKKIYEAIGNKENVKFYSDSSDFKVTLMNENYNRRKKYTGDKPAINRR